MRKLWQVSQILGSRSPFDLLDHNEAQLDFILEMYAEDNPDRGTFIRANNQPPLSAAKLAAAWERVLVGDAHRARMERYTPPALAAKLRDLAKGPPKPVIRRGPAAKDAKYEAPGSTVHRPEGAGHAQGGEPQFRGKAVQPPRR